MVLFGEKLKPFQLSNLFIALVINLVFITALFAAGIRDLTILMGVGFSGFASGVFGTHGVVFHQSAKAALFLIGVMIAMGCLGIYTGAFIETYLLGK